MGNPAFTNYLASIQANIGTLNGTVGSLQKQTRTLMRRVAGGGDDTQKSSGELAETQGELTKIVTKIDAESFLRGRREEVEQLAGPRHWLCHLGTFDRCRCPSRESPLHPLGC